MSGSITPHHDIILSNVIRSPASVRAMSRCCTLTATFVHRLPLLLAAHSGLSTAACTCRVQIKIQRIVSSDRQIPSDHLIEATRAVVLL